MISRVQITQLEEGLKEHLQKHGSKYLGVGALGAAGMAGQALSGESGAELKGHAEDVKAAHEKAEGLAKFAEEKKAKGLDHSAWTKKAEDAKEEKQASMKKFSDHPALVKTGLGLTSAGALGAAALLKRKEEKKQ